MDPEMLYIRLGGIVKAAPALTIGEMTPEKYKWLADAYALVKATGDIVDASSFKLAMTHVTAQGGFPMIKVENSAKDILAILYRALSVAELNAPVSVKGSFIPAGNAFDAFTVVSEILNKAQNNILIIDPYLDQKVLTDFMITSPDRVEIKLLTDEREHKTTLLPAVEKWKEQYGAERPIQLRFLPHRAIHDRLIIIDNEEVWDVTQSFNAFAKRAPASINRFQDPEMKIEAYNDMWENAKTEL